MIKIEPYYRAVEELEDEWNCNISDIFNWASQGLLNIWETDCLRLRQTSEPISKEKADEIFHSLTLKGENLFDHLEMDFDPQAFEHHTCNDYAIKNEEIQRFEQLHKKPESEEERKARIQKQREAKQKAAEMREIVFMESFCTDRPTYPPATEEELQRIFQQWREQNPGIKVHEPEEATNSPIYTFKIPSENHPYQLQSIIIHCWNSLYKERPESAPAPRGGCTEEIKGWLQKNYPDILKYTNKTRLIKEIANPRPRGCPTRDITYTANPDASKTFIEIPEGHDFASEKLVLLVQCCNHFYKDNTSPDTLLRKEVVEWLKNNCPDSDLFTDTAINHLAKVANPKSTDK